MHGAPRALKSPRLKRRRATRKRRQMLLMRPSIYLKAVNPRVADTDTRSREILPDGAPDRGQNLADQHEMFVAPETTNARVLLLCQESEDPKRSEVRC